MKITVYGSEKCPWTEKTIDWLESKGVKKFKFHDVLKDFKMREEMIKKSGQYTLPVTEMDGKIIIGFDRQHLERILLS